MPSFLPPSSIIRGKAGGLQIQRWQTFAVDEYGFTLAALTLEPSDFCNNGVTIGLAVTREGIPVRCWVLPGNQHDSQCVDQVQKDLNN